MFVIHRNSINFSQINLQSVFRLDSKKKDALIGQNLNVLNSFSKSFFNLANVCYYRINGIFKVRI